MGGGKAVFSPGFAEGSGSFGEGDAAGLDNGGFKAGENRAARGNKTAA